MGGGDWGFGGAILRMGSLEHVGAWLAALYLEMRGNGASVCAYWSTVGYHGVFYEGKNLR